MIESIDFAVSEFAQSIRTPLFNQIAIDITALGSGTVITLVTICFFILLYLRDLRRDALHLASAALGAGILTRLLKNWIERPRPTAFDAIVDVGGFSFPSGHSLMAASMYVTFGILACRLYRRHLHRGAIFAMFGFVAFSIGVSRIYLGVHYATDVVAGITIGALWAIGLAKLLHRPVIA